VFSLKDKVSLITGGNGGIGRGIAIGYANSGSKVAIVGRNQEKSKKVKEEILSTGGSAESFYCDVADYKSVEKCVSSINDKFGDVNILVNNAGIGIRKKEPQELSPEDWRTVMDTNLASMHYFSSLLIDQMKKNKSGKMVNIGSMLSIFGASHAAVYAASKGGVVQYTKSCAVAWAKYGIQVNAILPGYITTNLTDGFRSNFPEEAALVTSRIPSERWGVPEDLAGTAIFLASESSNYVTGASVAVDGGYSVRG